MAHRLTTAIAMLFVGLSIVSASYAVVRVLSVGYDDLAMWHMDADVDEIDDSASHITYLASQIANDIVNLRGVEISLGYVNINVTITSERPRDDDDRGIARGVSSDELRADVIVDCATQDAVELFGWINNYVEESTNKIDYCAVIGSLNTDERQLYRNAYNSTMYRLSDAQMAKDIVELEVFSEKRKFLI